MHPPRFYRIFIVRDMKIKQKILTIALLLGFAGMINTLVPAAAHAACAGVETSIVNCDQSGQGKSAKDSGIWGVLLLALNIMTAGVGILAVGGIVYGAILYASAEEKAAQVEKAKEVIRNVIIGLIAYGAMYMVLNFLIPGGIFT